MTAYYNDFDEGACAWLRELIKQGHIADGVVDNRSILEVDANELKEFTQCHFFAGIGGWSYALRLAGWPDERPIWTGSPPCQPFSDAGKGDGRDDERHLAPHFLKLVREARPAMLFGEQVASAAAFGKATSKARKQPQEPPQWAWLDDLSDRLEAAHYAVGASDLPSAGVGAPNIRQRTFFGAYDLRLASSELVDPFSLGCEGSGKMGRSSNSTTHENRQVGRAFNDGERCGLADSDGGNASTERQRASGQQRLQSESGGLVRGEYQGARLKVDGLGDAYDNGSHGATIRGGNEAPSLNKTEGQDNAREFTRASSAENDRATGRGERDQTAREQASPTNGFWRGADWLFCRDGRWRPVEASSFPLAYGVSSRVGLLRGYGNAINPHVAKEFILAFMEAME